MAQRNFMLVCGGEGCTGKQAKALHEQLGKEVREQGADKTTQVVRAGCFGCCEQGPVVRILPGEALYANVRPEDARELVAEHILKGRPVKRLLLPRRPLLRNSSITSSGFIPPSTFSSAA